MRQRITELSFIIGLFFFIVSLILLIGYFTSDALSSVKNVYSGIVFLLFGLFMIFVPTKKED
jgi:putative Mn2+ efflux pump MntP